MLTQLLQIGTMYDFDFQTYTNENGSVLSELGMLKSWGFVFIIHKKLSAFNIDVSSRYETIHFKLEQHESILENIYDLNKEGPMFTMKNLLPLMLYPVSC